MSDSVAARVNGERLVLLGWARAILLQVAHPLVAAGVAGHSEFRAGSMASARRLHHTIRAMLALTFGTEAERTQALDAIRAIHRRVRGTLSHDVGPYPAGTVYSAEDPALVAWVHVTIVESSVVAYEALVAPLTPDERDRYCAEAAGVAVALGARPEDVPLTWHGLTSAVAGTCASTTLHIGDDARAIAAAVLAGPFSAVTFPATWINRRLTTGWLPASVRGAYGLRWDTRTERQFKFAERTCRRMRRVLPAALGRWPAARRPGTSPTTPPGQSHQAVDVSGSVKGGTPPA